MIWKKLIPALWIHFFPLFLGCLLPIQPIMRKSFPNTGKTLIGNFDKIGNYAAKRAGTGFLGTGSNKSLL